MATSFADVIFKSIFLNESWNILIQMSQKYVSRVSIDSKPTLVQITAWRRTGEKLEPEPMMT